MDTDPVTPELDTDRLATLFEDLGRNQPMIAELVRIFAEQVEELRLHRETGDPELADLVHQVTGSCAMLTSAEMTERLRNLEQRIRSEEEVADDVLSVLDDLRSTSAMLDDWVRDLINR